MKTTVEIADALLKQAKALADRDSTTLRALIEEGLRAVLSKRSQPGKRPKIKPVLLKGRPRQEAKGLTWDKIMDMANER